MLFTSNQPNIFKFATSELSQDAFICWLVSYANCPENEVLNRCARDFITLLYNLKKGLNRINETNVEGIDNLKRQYCHTDVYFQALINGNRISFVVEDKTGTSHHSNQLLKYKKDIIKKDDINEEDLICIYFKTGYIVPVDEKAKDYGYAILDYKTAYEFLQGYKTNNVIFESYKQYIKEDFYNFYEKNKRQWETDDYKSFEHYFAQLEFMKELAERCPENVQYNYVGQERICNGWNRGGTPWTQLYFAKFKDILPGKISEKLFYRLDKRKNPKAKKTEYYLSIRQYAQVKDKPGAKEKKLERLQKYKQIFEGLKDSTSLVFAKERNDWHGANESEIAILFFNKENNKPTAVLKQIGKIHEQFVKRIQLTDTITNS